MNNRKMILILFLLVIVYFVLRFSFSLFSHGHHLTYSIKKNQQNYEIEEIYTQNKKELLDHYQIKITYNKQIFSFQVLENLPRGKKIIQDIYSFQDDQYTCIDIVFKDKRRRQDVICKKGGIDYPYQSMKGKDPKVDQFVLKLDYSFSDSKKVLKQEGNITIYQNLVKNHYIGLENYKGLYLINLEYPLNNLILFDKDIYKKEISSFLDRYYLVADYHEDYRFHEFYIIDLINSKKKTIVSDNALPMDSYIQGNYGFKTYLFDRSNKKQYEIDLDKRKIKQNGDIAKGIQLYKDHKAYIASAYDAEKTNLTFYEHQISSHFQNKKYDFVFEPQGKFAFYDYLLEKENNYYKIFRVPISDRDQRLFIGYTTDPNIILVDDYIYYRHFNDVYYYHDDTGNRLVFTNREFEFNDSLKFGVFIS